MGLTGFPLTPLGCGGGGVHSVPSSPLCGVEVVGFSGFSLPLLWCRGGGVHWVPIPFPPLCGDGGLTGFSLTSTTRGTPSDQDTYSIKVWIGRRVWVDGRVELIHEWVDRWVCGMVGGWVG